MDAFLVSFLNTGIVSLCACSIYFFSLGLSLFSKAFIMAHPLDYIFMAPLTLLNFSITDNNLYTGQNRPDNLQ